jgi:hypothetical protein
MAYVYQVADRRGYFIKKIRTSIGEHAWRLRDDGYVCTLRLTILLRNTWDDVVPDNVFIVETIIRIV